MKQENHPREGKESPGFQPWGGSHMRALRVFYSWLGRLGDQEAATTTYWWHGEPVSHAEYVALGGEDARR